MSEEKIKEIIIAVAQFYNIKYTDLIKDNRYYKIAMARHAAAGILRESGLTLKRIAEALKRDHSTVINSLKSVSAMQETNIQAYSTYQACRLSIQAVLNIEDSIQKNSTSGVVYLCGAITGLPKEEVEAKFNKAEGFLAEYYSEVINPYKICKQECLQDWNQCMQLVLPYLFKSNYIYVIDHPSHSRGALWEIAIAQDILQIPVYLINSKEIL
jgi:hypothetical protein